MERIQRIINNGVNLEGVNTTCSSSVNRYAGWEFSFSVFNLFGFGATAMLGLGTVGDVYFPRNAWM